MTNATPDLPRRKPSPPGKSSGESDRPRLRPVPDPEDGTPLDVGNGRTDLGNAGRLVARFGHELLYVESIGWHRWDGCRWRRDPDGNAPMRAAMKTVRGMYGEAQRERGEDSRKALATWAIKSESANRLTAMVRLAQELDVRCEVADLDNHPLLLTVANGTVDLATGTLRPANQADRITQRSPVEFDPEATCPTWDRFLERIQPDPEMRAYLARAVGYSLTGENGNRVMFCCYGLGSPGDSDHEQGKGNGSNGKTTFLEAVMELMGDYATAASKDLLVHKPTSNAGGPTEHLARLRPTRMVAAPETARGERMAEDQVKRMTGGDTITARFLQGHEFTFEAKFKIWLATNYLLEIRGTDDGIWDRVQTIPFPVRLPEAERDPKLREKLRAELPGILNWAVAGCLDWLGRNRKLDPPAVVLRARREYRENQDTMARFLAECTFERSGVETQASVLYEAYREWAIRSGERPEARNKFGMELGKIYRSETRGVTRYQGVGLIDWTRSDPGHDPEPPPDPEPPLPPDPGSGGGPVSPGDSPAQQFDRCRSCGDPCHPVNGGLHPNCTDPDLGPRPGPADRVDQEPDPGSSAQADAPSESSVTQPVNPVSDPVTEVAAPGSSQVVTRRRKRPWTPQVTVFPTWSTGKGVDERGGAIALPARAPIGKFLAALPDDAQRVVLVGQRPGKTGPGLEKWATGPLEEGWQAGAHYLDADALAARYVRPDGRRVEVHLLSSWTREAAATAKPADVAEAFALFAEGLRATFGQGRLKPGEERRNAPELDPVVLGSAASTGRELLLRSLPAGHEYPVLEPEHRALIHHTTGQGRFELLTADHGPDELPGLYCYDMRWSYAALCRGVTGSGPAVLDQGSEFLGWPDKAPARYEVEFTVPEGWDRLGLLPVHQEGWPNRPGSRWRTWVDARELLFADRHGWPIAEMRILRRLRFQTDPARSRPLRTWADKLMELRGTWLPAQQASETVTKLVEDLARSCLLAGLGALQGRRHKVTHSVHRQDAADVPEGAEARLAGDRLIWTEETEPTWLEMVHPEWVSQVWAEQRCRLLDTGPNAKQANAGALHIPYADLVALRADAVWSTTDPGWRDLGGVGQFRPKVARPGPVPTPRTVSELLAYGG